MQSSSNFNSNSNNNNNSNEVLNLSISVQERTIIIENIKKFLIEHLPPDQVATPQKAHELAVRFESHVAYNTNTKEQYQGMISEKLRMIKMKAAEVSPALPPQTSVSGPQIPLTPQEIVQISNRLQQIRPQIPQIDKLLTLHSKLANPPANSLDMIKKLTDCRNILVTQIEIAVANRKNFALNLSQLNLLIEQVQRLFNSLVSKMKESAGVTTTNNVNSNSSISTNTTNNNANNNNVNIPILTATNASLSAVSSATASSSASSVSMHSSVKPKTKLSANSGPISAFENTLQQRLTIPTDLLNDDRIESSTSSNSNSECIKKFISISSYRKSPQTSTSHLKKRNRILSAELKALQQELNFKFLIQEAGLGGLNILISTEKHRFIFQTLPKYPFEKLIYRIELKGSSSSFLLPNHMEPKNGPFTLSTVLRRFHQNVNDK